MSEKRGGVCFLLMVIASIAGSFAIGLAGFFYPWLYNLVPSSVISELLLLLPAVIMALLTPAGVSEMFALRRMPFKQGLLSAALIAAAFPVAVFCNSISTMFVDNTVLAMSDSILSEPFPVMVALIGVFGPLCEELCFRGYIFQNLKSGGKTAAAAVVSGILFGLIHMNLNQALYGVALGTIMAFAVAATGSLWSSIIMHVLLNSLEVAGMYLADYAKSLADTVPAIQEMMEAEQSEITAMDICIYGVIALIGVAFCVLIIRKMRSVRMEAAKEVDGEEEGFLTESLREREEDPFYGSAQEEEDNSYAHVLPDDPQHMLRGDAITEAEFPSEGSLQDEKGSTGKIFSVPLIIGAVITIGYIAVIELLL